MVEPYGNNKLVYIADEAEEFIEAAKNILRNSSQEEWLQKIDIFLEGNSWDITWDRMLQLIYNTAEKKKNLIQSKKPEAYV